MDRDYERWGILIVIIVAVFSGSYWITSWILYPSTNNSKKILSQEYKTEYLYQKIHSEKKDSFEKKVYKTLNILQKNITLLDSLQEMQIKHICESFNYSNKTVGIFSDKYGGSCEIKWGKLYFLFYMYNRILSKETTDKELDFIMTIDNSGERRGIQKRIDILREYRKQQETYLGKIKEINLGKSKLEVAKVLNDTKVIATIKRGLIHTMHEMNKDLVSANMQ